MNKKIFLSVLLFLFFLIIMNINSQVNAYTVKYKNNDYSYDFITEFDYTVIFATDGRPDLVFFISTSKPIILDKGSETEFTYAGGYSSRQCYRYPDNYDYGGWDNGTIAFTGGINVLLYSNYDIYDNDNNLIIEATDKIDLVLSVDPSSETKNVPVVISSGFYSLDIFENILVQYNYTVSGSSLDSWQNCLWGFSSDGNSNKYNYYINAYHNGTYHFRLVNLKTMEYIYKDVVIDNILYSPDDINNYVNGVFDPIPFLSYEYINNDKINVVTQKFFIDQIIDLQCFYAKDVDKENYNNMDLWTKVEARVIYDEVSSQDIYQFYFEIDNSDFNADGIYTVCFYNVFLDKYTYSDIIINFDEILKVDGSVIWKYVNFFKERLGFLIYPFDLTINTLKRISSIDYDEPKFNIPDIYEPFTQEKIISATSFKFNDFLKNDVFKYVYDVYLIIVDAVIIFGVLDLARKKIAGVFK